MTFKLPALTLLAALTSTAIAQTPTTPTKKTTAAPTHHATTTTATAAATKPVTPAADPADNPPNVPKVDGAPKPLYALRYVDVVVGTGPLAEQRRYYTVHYTGWLTDGTKFDSSVDRGQPITFPYGARQVIPGWDTGFQGMHVGGKRRLYIPYQLAYGENGRPPTIPAKSDLIFDIELVGQSETPPQPPAAAAPAAKPATDPAKPAADPAKPESAPATTAPDSKPATAPPATQPKTPPHPEGV